MKRLKSAACRQLGLDYPKDMPIIKNCNVLRLKFNSFEAETSLVQFKIPSIPSA